tara:strand:- start:8005 stop:8271 length:267 start_codon:yes stop_codon:yes gene_type:complete
MSIMGVYILAGITSISIILLLYIIRNLYIKNKIYERWIVETREEVESMHSNITKLDANQMFEKDDEVGVIFTDIKKLIDSFKQRVTDE